MSWTDELWNPAVFPEEGKGLGTSFVVVNGYGNDYEMSCGLNELKSSWSDHDPEFLHSSSLKLYALAWLNLAILVALFYQM